ncbi:MAG: hypothetical protein AB1847_12845 [bacterium]
MERKKRTAFSLIILVTLVAGIFSTHGSSMAWWSGPGTANTHHRLGEGAVAGIPQDEYPDITTSFGEDIIGWSSNVTDDQRAHANQGGRMDGPVEYWWKLALSQYGVFQFAGSGDPLSSPKPGAYYYLALIVHLTEDMGVPAHAYNIPHSASTEGADNMEQLANFSYREAAPVITVQDTGKDPLLSYRLSRERTLSATGASSWRIYYNNDGTCGMRYGLAEGHYGEFCGAEDIFPLSWEDTTPTEREVISSLLGASGGYAGGVLTAASRSLPPLVRDLTIGTGSAPVIDPDRGTTISFTILENRSQVVYVTIMALGEDGGGEYIITTRNQPDDQAGPTYPDQAGLTHHDQAGPVHPDRAELAPWDNKEVVLSRTGSPGNRQLPWEKRIILTGWKGTSVQGQLTEGLYTLKILVEDQDDNEVNEVYPEINADSTPGNDTQAQFRIGRND